MRSQFLLILLFSYKFAISKRDVIIKHIQKNMPVLVEDAYTVGENPMINLLINPPINKNNGNKLSLPNILYNIKQLLNKM